MLNCNACDARVCENHFRRCATCYKEVCRECFDSSLGSCSLCLDYNKLSTFSNLSINSINTLRGIHNNEVNENSSESEDSDINYYS